MAPGLQVQLAVDCEANTGPATKHTEEGNGGGGSDAGVCPPCVPQA